MDDSTLMRGVAAQDPDAFAALFSRFGGRVQGLLAKSLPGSVAEEVTQEVFVRIWRGAQRYDPGRATVATWIFTIARNARIDALRRHGRARPDPTDPVWVPSAAEAPDAATARRQGTDRLQAILDGLPQAQRETLQRIYLQGQTLKAAADEMSVPVGTAKSRLRLALARLRTTLPSPRHGGDG